MKEIQYVLISLLSEYKFVGTDISLEISLFEYGQVYHEKSEELVCYIPKEENQIIDNLTECFVCKSVTRDYVLDLFDIYEKEIYSYIGVDKNTYNENQSTEIMISDIISYIGVDEVIGYCYTLSNIDELIEELNRKFKNKVW